MDNAVALVQAYLRVNGYFTVTEFPVLEEGRRGNVRTLTDLDLLAFRFPGAGRLLSSARGNTRFENFVPDPVLGVSGDTADMIVGEVKEGRARVNETAFDQRVLAAALARFGCCLPGEAPYLARMLLRDGEHTLPSGHRIRIVAFGSTGADGPQGAYRVIRLGHVVRFLEEYLREYWDVLRHADLKDPALGFLLALEKARRGVRAVGESREATIESNITEEE